jgi:hypothetical protein
MLRAYDAISAGVSYVEATADADAAVAAQDEPHQRRRTR